MESRSPLCRLNWNRDKSPAVHSGIKTALNERMKVAQEAMEAQKQIRAKEAAFEKEKALYE